MDPRGTGNSQHVKRGDLVEICAFWDEVPRDFHRFHDGCKGHVVSVSAHGEVVKARVDVKSDSEKRKGQKYFPVRMLKKS